MPAAPHAGRVRSMPTTVTSPPSTLARLAEDLRVAAWLLSEDDPVRGYLEMLAALPPEAEAWQEVLAPWLDELRRGGGPSTDARARARAGAAGAVGVAALRTARELPASESLATSLQTVARWAFWLVRPEAH